jgi:bifunctional UDP-N-acetylglucosamine pyrophosphorylase/glucosamine-1-phosphate N-acetyltransferase
MAENKKKPAGMAKPPVPLHVVILAAGQGTRMQSNRSKVLHRIAGRPMLDHVIAAARGLQPQGFHIVIGRGGDEVRSWYAAAHPQSKDVAFATQEQQLGTAHAVQQAMPGIADGARVLVLYGDVPLIETSTLEDLLAAAGDQGLGILVAEIDNPFGYGRILRRGGKVVGVVEERDASPAQRKIREINTGVIAAPARELRRWLSKVGNDNAKGEYYLTDVVRLAAKDGARIQTAHVDSAEQASGVNDRLQLARQERSYQRLQADKLMRQGVSLVDPDRFDLRGSLLCGQDVEIDVGVVIEGEVELGDHVYVGPYTLLRNAKVGADTRIESHCVVESAVIGRQCSIGPFARFRPSSRLADKVHIGNFVEIKNSVLGEGTKANHLAYLGDADIGSKTNVGAGVITCNYDGANKFRTTIGDEVFIGSDSQLIAPVTIGDRAYIAAGSTIAKDAPADQLTINRAREQRSVPWKRPVKK